MIFPEEAAESKKIQDQISSEIQALSDEILKSC